MNLVYSQVMRPWLVFSLLYLFSFAVAAFFAVQLDPPGCCMTNDTNSYTEYWSNDLFNFRRTPGYPVLIELAKWLSDEPFRVLLWMQVAVFSFTAPLIYLLLKALFPAWNMAPVVGAVTFALVDNGKVYIHQYLTEAIYTPASFLAFALLCIGARYNRPGLVLASALAAGVTTLIRPNFALFVLLMPVLAYLLSDRLNKRVLASAMAILVAFPAVLAAVNYAKVGVFSPSSIAAETAAYYWGARTLNIVDHPSDTYGMMAMRYRQTMQAEAKESGSLKGSNDYYRAQVVDIVFAHPWPATVAFWRSLTENIPKPFSHGIVPLNGIFFVLVGWGAYRLFREYDPGFSTCLVLFVLFFWGQFGITYWQDQRLAFPLDPYLFTLFACVFAPQTEAWMKKQPT